MESQVTLSVPPVATLSLPKRFFPWPSNGISKVSELLIWEILGKPLCSAVVPRGFSSGAREFRLSFHMC